MIEISAELSNVLINIRMISFDVIKYYASVYCHMRTWGLTKKKL